MTSSVVRAFAALFVAAVVFGFSDADAARLGYVFRGYFGDTGAGRDELVRPAGMSISSRDLLAVAESQRDTVQFFDRRRDWLKGVGAPRGTGAIEFKEPCSVVFDDADRLWVADTGNDRVVQINQNGLLLRALGSRGIVKGEFRRPVAIAYGGRRLFVADAGNKRIQVFDDSGEVVALWDEWSVGGGAVKSPGVLAWSDEKDGRLWLVNEGSARLFKLDMEGRKVDEIDLSRLVEGDIRVVALYSDPGFDRLFVCDAGSNRILVLSGGRVLTRIDLPPGVRPGGMALAWNLDLFVADRAKGRILRYARQ